MTHVDLHKVTVVQICCTYREADRQTDGQTNAQTDMQTGRQRVRTERLTCRSNERLTHVDLHKVTVVRTGCTYRQTDKQTGRLTHRQTGRQTGIWMARTE